MATTNPITLSGFNGIDFNTNLDGSTGMIKTTRDGIANMLSSYSGKITDMQARLDQE
jgi:hypothetical protein